jgi:8-oxo-dGTP pyrophosphatase MutT (NUDIX family)
MGAFQSLFNFPSRKIEIAPQSVLEMQMVQKYIKRCTPDVTITDIEVKHSFVFDRPGTNIKSGFAVLNIKAHPTDHPTRSIPGFVLVSDDSVAALVLVSNSDREEEAPRILLVGQYRVGVLAFAWELPAGILENGVLNGAAAKEVKEETGQDLSNFSDLGGFYPSVGRVSERVHVVLGHITLDTNKILKLENNECGNVDEQEFTRCRLIPLTAKAVAELGDSKASHAFVSYLAKSETDSDGNSDFE